MEAGRSLHIYHTCLGEARSLLPTLQQNLMHSSTQTAITQLTQHPNGCNDTSDVDTCSGEMIYES